MNNQDNSEAIQGVTHNFEFVVSIKNFFPSSNYVQEFIRNPGIEPNKSMTFEGFVVGNRDVIFDIEITLKKHLSVRMIRRSQRLSAISVTCNCALAGITQPREPLMFIPTKLLPGSDSPESSTISMKQGWDLGSAMILEYQIFRLQRQINEPRIVITGSIFYEFPPVTMQRDLGRLLNDAETSDVDIVIGENKFHAHKLLLATRSSFFKGMFNSNMKENFENVFKLPKEDPKVFEQVLHYIYTDTCPEISTFAVDLLLPSDKYDIQGLLMICEEEMMKTMTTENVCDYLMGSWMANSTRIYDQCVNFIGRNREDIEETGGWIALKAAEDFTNKFLVDITAKTVQVPKVCNCLK